MRIVLIHNKYKQPGDEDVIFHLERTLVSTDGHRPFGTISEINHQRASVKSPSDNPGPGYRQAYTPEKNYSRCMEVNKRAIAMSRQSRVVDKSVPQSG